MIRIPDREAVGRIREPVEILEGPMLAVAVVGLLVNLPALPVVADRRRTVCIDSTDADPKALVRAGLREAS